MRYAIVIILAVCCGLEAPGYLADPDSPFILRALTYHFFSAGVMHFAINAYSAWVVFAPRKNNGAILALSFLIATAAYAAAPGPTVGFSNIIYAAVGLLTPSFNSTWWKRPETIIFLVLTFFMLALPNVSALTHIISFTAGVGAATLIRYIKRIRHDIRSLTE